MDLLSLDIETYYDDEYSVRRMTNEEYIRDERFEIILLSVAVNQEDPVWYTGTHQELREQLQVYNWSNAICVGHNLAEFDALIMVEHLGIRARFWQDTLSIARALGNGKQSYSLAALAERYGLPAKGTEVVMAKGKRRADFSARELAAYGGYCAHDTWLCRALYLRQIKHLPKSERAVVHWFCRMYAEPRLALDGPLIQTVLDYEERKRKRLLTQVAEDIGGRDLFGEFDLGEVRKLLRSKPRFAALLTKYGIEPAQKLSEKKTETAGHPVYDYAFAKTDRFMEDLLNHPDPLVAAAAQARVGVNSAIRETRLARFAGIAQRGLLPAPFAYGKLHTHRAAGAGKINLQNMGRPETIDPDTLRNAPIMVGDDLYWLVDRRVTPEGVVDKVKLRKDGTQEEKIVPAYKAHVAGLRDCIMAPPGKKLVVADSGAIELRIAHYLAGQMDTVEALRRGVKVYEQFGQELYGYPINKQDHPRERNHAKVAMLQLQYQAGAGSFQTQARVMAGVILTAEEAEYTVSLYRTKFAQIKKMWYRCQRLITDIYNGNEAYIDQWGLCRTGKNKIILPNGLEILYTGLHQQEGEYGSEWVYFDKETRREKRLYGGVVFENMCQALGRLIVFEQSVKIESRYGGHRDTGVALTVHDEQGTVVQEHLADQCLKYSLDVMSTPPKWWPDLPLTAEGEVAQRYGAAK